MVRTSKWIAGTSPEQPLSAAAREALSARLDAVWRHLEQARAADAGVGEAVHQSRVWSRRAAAAMTIFEVVLPLKKAEWFRKQLKRIRRKAGDARDLDVLAARLTRRAQDQDATAVQAALARIQARRTAAQGPINEIHDGLARKDFGRRVADLVERVRFRGEGAEPTFGCAAREELRHAVGPFFQAAEGDLADVAALHGFRIAGKRLRYSMEVFAGAFGPTFRQELYPVVERLQEKLGDINDHATAAARFQRWLDDASDDAARAQMSSLLSAEHTALRRAQRNFFEWWTPDRHASLERGFSQALAAEGLLAG